MYLLLISIFFWFCKKKEAEIKPTYQQTFASPAFKPNLQTITALQNAFAKYHSGVSSTRNNTNQPYWIPIWRETKAYSLSEGYTLIYVPVYRYASVQYNSEIGFMRRLKAILSPNGEVIDLKIAEIITHPQTLQNYQDDLMYYAFTGALEGGVYYEISLAYSLYNLESQSSSVYTIVYVPIFGTGLCNEIKIDPYSGEIISWTVAACPKDAGDVSGGGSSGGGSSGGSNTPGTGTNPPTTSPNPQPPAGTNPPTNPTPSPTPPGSGSPPIVVNPIFTPGNPNPWTPTVPPTVPPISPIYPSIPLPWQPWEPIEPPAGVTPVDPGTNLPSNYQPSELLKSITQKKPNGTYDFGNLSDDAIKKLDETIQALNTKSEVAKLVLEELQTHKVAWKQGNLSGSNTGNYNPRDRSITIKVDEDNFFFEKAGTVLEELLHALQHKKYGSNFVRVPVSNLEFEAKLIKELIIYNIFVQDGRRYDWLNKHYFSPYSIFPKSEDSDRFKYYLREVTQKGYFLPKTMEELTTDTETYWTIFTLFREKWAEWYGVNHPYSMPYSSQQKPDVLLFLFNQCNCSQRLIY